MRWAGAVGLFGHARGAPDLGLLVGFGIAGTGFGVILAVVGRAASDENRSMALGIATAAGSAGQVVGAPVAEWLLTFWSWQTVFLIFAVPMVSPAVRAADDARARPGQPGRTGTIHGPGADAGVP
jgi:MFS family permease